MVMDFSAGNVLEHVELNNMILAMNNDGVHDGLVVSQRAAAATMGIDVAAGNAYISGTTYNEAGVTELAIEAAHATLYRKDLITYDPTTGNPIVTKGTDHAGGTGDPIYPPNIPAGDILLAIVDVDAAASTIVDGDIHDGRIIISIIPTIDADPADLLQKYSDAEVHSSVTSYTELKTLPRLPPELNSGELRIKFDLRIVDSLGAYDAHARIYKNGVAVGTARSHDTTTFTTFSEDIAGWSGNDEIELYGYVDHATKEVQVRNFRVYAVYSLSW